MAISSNSVTLVLAVAAALLFSLPQPVSYAASNGCRAAIGGSGAAGSAKLIKSCSQALEAPHLDAFERAQILDWRASAMAARGDHAGAANDLKEAARLVPSDPLIARDHADALRRARKFDEADQEYGRALRLEPHPEVWFARCALRLEAGRYRDAVADCETVHATDPSERSALFMARAYVAAGRRESAVVVLQNAAAAMPSSKPIRDMLRSMLRVPGRTDQVPAANASRR